MRSALHLELTSHYSSIVPHNEVAAFEMPLSREKVRFDEPRLRSHFLIITKTTETRKGNHVLDVWHPNENIIMISRRGVNILNDLDRSHAGCRQIAVINHQL